MLRGEITRIKTDDADGCLRLWITQLLRIRRRESIRMAPLCVLWEIASEIPQAPFHRKDGSIFLQTCVYNTIISNFFIPYSLRTSTQHPATSSTAPQWAVPSQD